MICGLIFGVILDMEIIKVGLFKKFIITSEEVDQGDYFSKDLLYKNKKYVLKKYKMSEPFYNEVRQIEALERNKIRIPRVIKINKKDMSIIEEVVEGTSLFDLFIDNKLEEKHFEKLFLIYRFARFEKHDIDYRPQNFILDNKNELIYVGRKIFPSEEKLNLENYGLRFYFDSVEAKQNAKELGYNLDRKILTSAEINKKIVLICIKYW